MKGDIHSSLNVEWENLLRHGQEMTLGKDQVLFYEGHYPYGLFVILEGEVVFTKEGISCGENHFWQSPRGRVIGFDPLVEQTPSCCTSRATQDCRVVFISKTQLLPFFEGHDQDHGPE